MIDKELKLRECPISLRAPTGANNRQKTWEENREKLKELLCLHEYGFLPPEPKDLKFEILRSDERFFANTAIYQKF